MNKKFLITVILIISIIIYIIENIENNYFSNFKKIPIFFDGKIKPIDSFSKTFSTELNIKNKKTEHIKILSDILFDFKEFSKLNVFKIKNENLIKNLELNYKKNNNYNFDDILITIKKNYKNIKKIEKIDYDNRTKDQTELLDLYYKISYIVSLKNYFQNTEKKEENEIAPFYILESENLWTSINKLTDKNEITEIINKMKTTYKDKKIWDQECKKIIKVYEKKLSNKSKIKIKIELIYNQFNLIYYSLILYLISIIIKIVNQKLKKIYINNKIIIKIIITGFIFHLAEIIMRAIITERPPVTNLYESIVFVNLIVTMFYIYYSNKIKFDIIFLSFINILQYVAYSYSIEGTNIKNLVPVLNTNFWLTLHVITITIGYSLCLISGLLAHFYLYLRINIDKNKELLKKFFNLIHIFIILSLLFSLFGTILGGIWADQSWGRFWGWDPKENGAMLIVLWLILITHSRMMKNSNALLYINGIIINNIMVFLAWFGVNLLNVGLHSYGFTKNISISIILLLFFELSYIIIFYLIFKKNKIKTKYL